MSEPLKRQSIVPRMDGIMRDIEKLKKLSVGQNRRMKIVVLRYYYGHGNYY